MKEKLIDTLFNHFDKEKNIIKKNLIEFMDSIWLECSDDYHKITLNIKIERIDKNVKNNKKENVEQLDKTK
jgi:hypothetical protein